MSRGTGLPASSSDTPGGNVSSDLSNLSVWHTARRAAAKAVAKAAAPGPGTPPSATSSPDATPKITPRATRGRAESAGSRKSSLTPSGRKLGPARSPRSLWPRTSASRTGSPGELTSTSSHEGGAPDSLPSSAAACTKILPVYTKAQVMRLWRFLDRSNSGEVKVGDLLQNIAALQRRCPELAEHCSKVARNGKLTRADVQQLLLGAPVSSPTRKRYVEKVQAERKSIHSSGRYAHLSEQDVEAAAAKAPMDANAMEIHTANGKEMMPTSEANDAAEMHESMEEAFGAESNIMVELSCDGAAVAADRSIQNAVQKALARDLAAGATEGKASVTSTSSRIKVCVRVRPFNERERKLQDNCCIVCHSRTRLSLESESNSPAGTLGESPSQPSLKLSSAFSLLHEKHAMPHRTFDFDRVYNSMNCSDVEYASQMTLMGELGKELTFNTLEGYNSCVFAYGNTGSGKTYNIVGLASAPEESGLLPRITEAIFDRMQEKHESTSYSCVASYLEIYNDKIQDLLRPPHQLPVKLDARYSPKVGAYIPNLTEVPVFCKEDILILLKVGSRMRTMASTSLQDTLRRSHCMFILEVTRKLEHDDGSVSLFRSKLNLTDLGCSEVKIKDTRTWKQGEGMINQSLSTMVLLTNKLAKMSKHSGAMRNELVPFRNSALAFLLLDSLAGNSKTVMLAALSPAESSYNETLRTLCFAEHVKGIETDAVEPRGESTVSLVARLREEVEHMREQVQQGNSSESEVAGMQALVEKYALDLQSHAEVAQVHRQQQRSWLALAASEITENMNVQDTTPHLVNMHKNPALDDYLVYLVHTGQSLIIGSGDACKIKLRGIGIKPRLATIANVDNRRVTLSVGVGRVLVNGKRVKADRELQDGDRLTFGFACCFRVVIPHNKQQSPGPSFSKAIAEVEPDVCSEKHHQCLSYALVLRNHLGAARAEAFVQNFTLVSLLVEEANQITAELRPSEHLEFSAEILADVSHLLSQAQKEPEIVIKLTHYEAALDRNQVNRGIFCARDVALNNHCGHTRISIWAAEDFNELVIMLREVYQACMRDGSGALLDFSKAGSWDPWHQVHPWELGELLEEFASGSSRHEAERELLRRGTPVDPHATTETTNLFYNLQVLTDRVMFGHQDTTASGVGWTGTHRNVGRETCSDIHDTVEDFPAVYGWDLGSTGGTGDVNLDGVYFAHMKTWIKEAYARGGLNTISLHLDNPVTRSDRSAWDTTPAVFAILPGGEYHVDYLDILDGIATFLKDLKTDDGTFIPVVLRPYHDHNQQWSWWSKKACSEEEFEALWQMTIKHFRDTHDIHHLLYAISPQDTTTETAYLERYPGDKWVDVMGLDWYMLRPDGTVCSWKELGKKLSLLGQIAFRKKKPCALTEVGFGKKVPSADWWTKHLLRAIQFDANSQRMAWVLVWRNSDEDHHFAPFPDSSSEADFRKFHEHDFTVFNKDAAKFDLYTL